MLKRLLRAFAVGIAVLAGGAVLWFSIAEYRNSREVPSPSEAELREHLSRATGWIFTNSASVATENNPMLWVFMRETGRLTGDTRLLTMATEYQEHYVKGTISQFFFDSKGSEQLAGKMLVVPYDWADYQRLFVYGATCNNSVREDPQVTELLEPTACDAHMMWLRSPWCRTHQLMGLRLAQKNHCEPDAESDRLVTAVQDSILAELRWDFRVEDAYLQKVMELLESGRRKDVKSVWIKQILDSQRADGGWDGADIIAHLPRNHVLVWVGGRLYPSITSQPPSNLHATAQGLYILALLLTPVRTAAPPYSQ